MTRPSGVSRNDYLGNGSVGPFPYTFPVQAVTELRVVKRAAATGVETVLNYPTDFSTTDVFPVSSGSITLTTALAVGDALAIRRLPALTQPTSFRTLGAFFPETHEDAFDHETDGLQYLYDAVARSVRLPETYDPALFSLILRGEAGKVLGWDSATVLTNKTLDSSAVALPGNSRTVATLSAYLANNAVFNMLDYYLVADGSDYSPALARACAAAGLIGNGAPVLIPAGGPYRFASQVAISASVSIAIAGAVSVDTTSMWLAAAGVVGSQYTFSAIYQAGTRAVTLTSVAGLAIGDYLEVRYSPNGGGIAPETNSHYRIRGIAGSVVTLDRGLDIPTTTAANTITKYTPITVTLDGLGHTVTFLQNLVGLISFDRCVRCRVANVDIVGTLTYGGAGVQSAIRASDCYGVLVADCMFRGIDGTQEISHSAVYRSTDVVFRTNRIMGSVQNVRGLEAFDSTRVTFIANHVSELGTPVAGLFATNCYHLAFIGNDVSNCYNHNGAALESGGIQASNSKYVSVTGNTVQNCAGLSAHIYLNSNDGLTVSGNTCSQTLNGSAAALIMIRSGLGVTVTGNTCIATAAGANAIGRGIQIRQVQDWVVSGNAVSGDFQSYGIGAVLVAGDSPNSCLHGLIMGNMVSISTTASGMAGIQIGGGGVAIGRNGGAGVPANIVVRGNHVSIRSSSGSGNLFGIYVNTQDGASENYCVVADNAVLQISGGASRYGLYMEGTTENRTRVFRNQMIDAGTTVVGTCPYVYDDANSGMLKRSGTTGARPALNAFDAGFTYYDTTTVSLQVWDGAAWHNSG